jgi:hypothetical protein
VYVSIRMHDHIPLQSPKYHDAKSGDRLIS